MRLLNVKYIRGVNIKKWLMCTQFYLRHTNTNLLKCQFSVYNFHKDSIKSPNKFSWVYKIDLTSL